MKFELGKHRKTVFLKINILAIKINILANNTHQLTLLVFATSFICKYSGRGFFSHKNVYGKQKPGKH